LARLSDYCNACGIPSALITCSFRTARDQARVMVEQYRTPERAASLYTGTKGTAVLAAWALHRTDPAAAIAAMVQVMAEVGFTSMHMDERFVTVDIAPSSIGTATSALLAHATGRKAFGEVKECFGPPSDAAIHIALIPPPAFQGKSWVAGGSPGGAVG
jgi:hypothetical protein